MKIVHVMLCGPVTDGWSYQDNLLTKYHRKSGYDVTMITSQWVWGENGNLVKFEKTNYRNEDDVKVIRLPMKGRDDFSRKFKCYDGLKETLESESPDILFIHGCQFLDINNIVKYLKHHKNVTVYVDNHADHYNSGRNWISYHILHKIIWKHTAHSIASYVTKFYGTVPARVNWLLDVYKLPKNKVELLVTGADDEQVDASCTTQRAIMKKDLNISNNDLVLLCGGKIDDNKQEILNLMESITSPSLLNVKLIVFGSVAEHFKDRFNYLLQCDKIIYVGWIKSQDIYKYFAISDLVLFPGLHSTLWEEAVGNGNACVFRKIPGFEHIDLGGNCDYFDGVTPEAILSTLQRVLSKDVLNKMKVVAQEKGRVYFSYKNISKRCTEKNNFY